MSDILSQEQIDALLASGGMSGGSSDFGLDEHSETPAADKYSSLTKIFELFCDQAGTVITTVLNKKTTFIPETCDRANLQTVQQKINSVTLSLTLSFKSVFEGAFYMIIKKKDVAVLSDLMMMGDGSADYSEDHKDAIGELFNQVMGAFCTSIGGEIGKSVSAGSVEVTEFDLDNPPFPLDSFDMIVTSLSAEESLDSYAVLLIPESLSEEIVEIAAPAQSSSETGSDSVGLSMSELDDLSRVTSFDSNDSFSETSLTGEASKAPRENIDMLLDIDLDVSIELGRTALSIKRVLELAPGSIVELDRMAGEPVDLMVNNKVVAKGEVVVIDESFGIRIVSLVSPEDRIKSLR